MTSRSIEGLRLLAASLTLPLGRQPRGIDPRRIGMFQVLAATLFLVAVSVLTDAWWAEPPRRFQPWGLTTLLAYLATVWITGLATAAIAGRTVLRAPLVALLTLSLVWIGLLAYASWYLLPDPGWLPYLLGGVLAFVVLLRALDGLDPGASRLRRLTAAASGAILFLVAGLAVQRAPVIETDWSAWRDEAFMPPRLTDARAEALLFEQARRIDLALENLAAQRPGTIDAYFLALAGDGGERVFAQEADYAARLFAQRFDAAGRTLVLANNLNEPETHPLATLSGLRRALAGLSRVMDTEEDLLILFATSHGSADHELVLSMDPLPLAQIAPEDLRAALDDAGIRWRVLLVSACYSGGFVDALSDATTLVITAASSDRTSFGCGPDADITWFGRAFFVEALNRTADPVAAFDIARDLIAAWEADADHEASDPQIRSTPLVEARIRAWLETIEVGPPLAFDAGGSSDQAVSSSAEAQEIEVGAEPGDQGR